MPKIKIEMTEEELSSLVKAGHISVEFEQAAQTAKAVNEQRPNLLKEVKNYFDLYNQNDRLGEALVQYFDLNDRGNTAITVEMFEEAEPVVTYIPD